MNTKLGFHIHHHFHQLNQPMILPAQTHYNCLDLNNRTNIHALPTPVHQTLALHNQTLLPSHNVESHNIIPSQTIIPVHLTAQSLPIAHTSHVHLTTMSNLPPSFTSTKPILRSSNKKHKSNKKRPNIAKIDDECLMTNHLTNHLIEDQL